ncbi:hypothetical protein [Hyalangium gracile]|uniref:hypothetical protein n=1 Tax=Hyalangium gracile TaxID=394092 RepID=UPI001CCA80A2|nr:hypothetical protein [Hyalangium gracile]
MKKLTGALVLSLSLQLLSGCRSAGETRDAEDASTPSSVQPTPSSDDAREDAQKVLPSKDDAGTTTGAGQPSAGVDLGGMKADSGTGSGMGLVAGGSGASSDPGTQAGKTSAEGSTSATLSEAERQAQESCLDKWLKSKKLDRYGSEEGTMYMGGTPLFDERTGESRDRLDFVYARHPEAKKACATPSKKPVAPSGPDTSPAPKETTPQKKK